MRNISEEKVARTDETLRLGFAHHGPPPNSRRNTSGAGGDGLPAAKATAELDWAKLSFRELQIVDLVADGRMSKEIATATSRIPN